MIGKINLWAQGIIIATIIGTVLQMVLPDNKNKKYIKVVIGIYVLLCIIQPLITQKINFEDFNFLMENLTLTNWKNINQAKKLYDWNEI